MGILAVGAFAIFFLFQNCSKVDLVKEASVVNPTLIFGTGDLCLGSQTIKGVTTERFSGYTVTHSYVANLNLILQDGKLNIDTDSDGLSDEDEVKYGFDPLKRHSTSKMLDSVCLNSAGSNNCQAMQPVCSDTETVFGLNDCDVKVLGLDKIGSQIVPGLDSDKDGMIDLLEILRKTDPAVADSLNDPDHDGVLNKDELQRGSDPLKYDPELSSSLSVQSSLSLFNNSKTCIGEEWKLMVQQIPFVQMPAFDDTAVKTGLNPLNLSHGYNENVAIIVFRIEPKLGFPGNPKFLYRKLKISMILSSFDVQSSDFIEAGEVLP